jgi:hypothetical protein
LAFWCEGLKTGCRSCKVEVEENKPQHEEASR